VIRRRGALALALVLGLGLAGRVPAADRKTPETPTTKSAPRGTAKPGAAATTLAERIAALEARGLLVEVRYDPKEVIDEVELEMAAQSLGELTTVSKGRKPALPDPGKVVKVVNRHIREVTFCYKKHIGGEVDMEEELILEFTIQTNGRLREILVDPEDFHEGPFGTCMARWTKKWRFPKFTGEVDEGVFQDNVSLALPLRFAPR